MKSIAGQANWKQGRYKLVSSSAKAHREWDAFVQKVPDAMKAAFERLSEHPLDAVGARQFPLKGKQLKPFWQYEITGGDRLFYAVDLKQKVVVVCVMPHAANSQAVAATVVPRGKSVLREIEAQENEAKRSAKLAEKAKLVARKPDFKAHLLGGPKVDDFFVERDRDAGRVLEL